MTGETRQRAIYVITDYVMTNVAMLLFNLVRYWLFARIDLNMPVMEFLLLPEVLTGQITVPLFMMLIYYLSGYYYNVTFRSRMDEFITTMMTSVVGAFLIYFILVVNDPIRERATAYEVLGALIGVLFICLYIGRITITLTVVRRLHNRRIGFNTLVVGCSTAGVKLVDKLNSMRKSMGFNIVGYVTTDESDTRREYAGLPVYTLDELPEASGHLNIKQLIVLPHRNGVHATISLINRLFPLGLSLFVSPFLFQMISGKSSFGNVAGEPLIDISSAEITPMTASIKRAFDIVFSLLALIVLSPVFLIVAIWVKLDSKGPVFYTQERIGYRKRRFNIIKFRTMKVDAEENGPALSTVDDPRITRIGHFLRKYRIDEFPQFLNVLKGDMSIVGPRPEREYYIRQIVERVPYYSLIHCVRPGVTSWGMVKYGYATTVDEMVERLYYDLVYIENVSFVLDWKIILYTVKTVVTGRGI